MMSALQTILYSSRSDSLIVNYQLFIKKASRLGGFSFSLAAAAVVIAAAAVIGRIAVVAATVAEQDDQQNDPAPVATTETIVIAHNTYLREITCGVCRSFQVIPQRKKCYRKMHRRSEN